MKPAFPPIQSIPLEQIDEDRLTDFSLGPVPEPLQHSIREIGVTHPVVLLPKGDCYQIACGHRRAHVARALGKTVLPSCVLENSWDAAALLTLNLKENFAHRQYSDIEKSLILFKLAQAGVAEANLIRDCLPLLNLERSKKLALDFQQTSALSPRLQKILHDLNIPLRVFAGLLRWDETSREATAGILETLRPGVNKVREILELTDDTANRDHLEPHEILNRQEIQTILNDPQRATHEKYDAVHQQLHQWRHPHLSDLQLQVRIALEKLKLDDAIKLRVPENFESEKFRIELRFSNREQLQSQAEQLFRISDSKTLKELLLLFKTIPPPSKKLDSATGACPEQSRREHR